MKIHFVSFYHGMLSQTNHSDCGFFSRCVILRVNVIAHEFTHTIWKMKILWWIQKNIILYSYCCLFIIFLYFFGSPRGNWLRYSDSELFRAKGILGNNGNVGKFSEFESSIMNCPLTLFWAFVYFSFFFYSSYFLIFFLFFHFYLSIFSIFYPFLGTGWTWFIYFSAFTTSSQFEFFRLTIEKGYHF